MQKRIAKWNIVIKYLASYVFILLIPLVISFALYRNNVDEIIKNANDANMTSLEQSRDLIDMQMEELDSVAWNIIMNPGISDTLFNPGQSDASFKKAVTGMKKDFYTYEVSNSFIDDYFIYFKYRDTIVTPNYTYRPQNYYREYIGKNMQPAYWQKIIEGDFDNLKIFFPLSIGKDAGNMVVNCAYKLPLTSSSLSLGILNISVNGDRFRNILGSSINRSTGAVYVLDYSGRILNYVGNISINIPDVVSKLKNTKGVFLDYVGDRNMVFTYTRSLFLGWTYISVIPQGILMEKAINMKNLVIIIIVLCLVIGIMMALLFAYRNSKPLQNLLEKVGEKIKFTGLLPYNNAYGFIENAVFLIDNKNKTLEETIKIQIPILIENFYTKLLKGEIRSAEEIGTHTTFLNLDVNALKYNVMAIHLEKFMNVEYSGLKVMEVLKRFDKFRHYVLNIDDTSVCLLLFLDNVDENANKTQINEFAARMRDILYEDYEMLVTIAVGGMYDNITDVHKSYEDAMVAMRYGNFSVGNAVLFYDDYSFPMEDYYFPPEEEIRLMNSLRAGSLEKTNDILDLIYEENFVKRQAGNVTREYLLNELKSTFIKISSEFIAVNLDNKKIEAMRRKLNRLRNEEDMFNFMRTMFADICNIVSIRKKSHNHILRNNIERFIAESFSKPDMALSYVADHFKISEAYLSKFFSDYIGEKFSSYISRLRIERAAELLRENDDTIEQISELVGFGSVHVFIKVFKKYRGITPGMFRNALGSHTV